MRYSLVVLFLISFSTFSQKKNASVPVTKRPLDHSVYDNWKEIPFKSLAPDGTVAVMAINPQDGDGKAVFYHLKTNAQDSVKRAAEIGITFDSKQVVFKIKPQQKVVNELRRQKKKKEDLPKDSLGIYSVASRKIEKVAEVKSFKIPEKAGGWLAYQLEAKKEVKPKAADLPTGQVGKSKAEEKKEENPPVGKAGKSTKKKKDNSDDNGYTLVLRSLIDGKEKSFGYVKEYAFAKFGQGLLFSSTGNDSTMKAGMYWYDLMLANLIALHEGKSKFKYKGLSISEDGKQAAFLVDTDTTKAPVRHFQLHSWKLGDTSAKFIDAENSLALPKNWMASEHYTPLFSKDGGKLFFGSTPTPPVADTTLLPEEMAVVEVWGGNDDYIYPQQNKQLDTEKKRSYLVAYDLATSTIRQIGSKEVPLITLGNEGNSKILLGESDVKHRKMITWDTQNFLDVYVFDLATNTRKLVQEKIKGNANLSPLAEYVYWYSLPDTTWFAYHVATEKTSQVSKGIRVGDEEDDHPDFPSSYGLAGWTKDDARLLIYDRYDIWSLHPKGNEVPVNLTKIGRAEKIRFRYVRLDNEERFINPEKELLLSAFSEITKAAGYYKLNLKTNQLTKLVVSDHRYSFTSKAKSSNQLLFTRESFREYPDVWATDFSFTTPKKISDANPQMKIFFWGSVERISWTSLDNIPLEGLLYKPEGFDPKKKYPMMVYFYEKYTEDIHQHYAPAPIRSFINFSLYASNGYLVFVPDIVYKIGYPGESAHNCVLPGVTSLISKGFVDEKHIGVQGHSWGGYQTAYLITRTNLFAAAEAGAPVVNMISAYGGVRWESGLSRMFQYEKSQTRLGASLWQKPLLYLENSPIFFADKVQTPLLMMHNDADGAVPWYQGIEYYMAMRRMNKPVWMLNYNGQGHGLTQRQDRTDFAIRMMQFFDYYLKNATMPPWMKTGISAVEKGITKGY
ncbi:MAG: prolyl oligopeptidase family serine peptidase [Cyclobacteriaceae bacterium]|nr:prolyl oligopeptidase family serine peptidase [Cyclobacteriaceae bacterium]